MKIAFIVQSEGRGHLTQAIAMYQLLVKNGHEIVGVFVGGSGKQLPDFFEKAIQANIFPLKSPYLIFKNKRLSLLATTLNIFKYLFDYFKSLKVLNHQLKTLQPDLILNFYESLGGIHQRFYKPVAPMICIGHQYLLLHPDFKHPEGWFDRLIVNTNTKLTAWKAQKLLALSFDKTTDYQRIKITPPLVRAEVLDLETSNENFILVYVTNAALADDIIAWQAQSKHIKIQGFWDKPTMIINENLVFNAINSTLFLDKMSRCTGVMTTAGFESVCEAILLNKPIMIVPVPEHYEQACNAIDAERIKAGIQSQTFDFDRFINFIPQFEPIGESFKLWVQDAEKIFLKEIV